MKSQISGIAMLGVALLAGQARATVVTINFDDLAQTGPPAGATVIPVTTQYLASDGVTFSSTAGHIVMVLSGTAYNTSSKPNVICTATSGGIIDCTQDFTLTFANPVSNLTFDAFGNDSTPNGGTFALADVFQGGVDNANIPLIVSQNQPGTCTPVDHSGCPTGVNADPQTLNFTGITKVVIHNNTDVNGTAYDNFSFGTSGSTNATPEPSTVLLAGLCGIVWAGRRFMARKSI
jgi:hypothetical protein